VPGEEGELDWSCWVVSMHGAVYPLGGMYVAAQVLSVTAPSFALKVVPERLSCALIWRDRLRHECWL
jgi:hypothetical protein